MKTAIITSVVLAFLIFVWIRFSSPKPAFPPLAIELDDPEMKAAREMGRATIAEFISLFRDHPKGAMVKWPFVTSSAQTEFLAAEPLEIDGENVKIRLISPPVSHTGQLERIHTVPLKDLVDWMIVTPGDKRKGGFTMRVMFKAARKQWGDLPEELKKEEARYLD